MFPYETRFVRYTFDFFVRFVMRYIVEKIDDFIN